MGFMVFYVVLYNDSGFLVILGAFVEALFFVFYCGLPQRKFKWQKYCLDSIFMKG